MLHILFVEDDGTIALGIEYSLRQEGFGVTLAGSLNEARKLELDRFDLILLDLGLPDGNGYELCREIRKKGDTPIIILTARDEEVNVVQGLDMGADDYVTKPFRLRELISRINAVLRRRKCGPENDRNISCGDLRMDTGTAKVTGPSGELQLTALEYRLLLTFMLNKGKVLTRNRLLESIWDAGGEFVNDNTLTVYIKRIREKISGAGIDTAPIKTVRGLGYIMEDGNE